MQIEELPGVLLVGIRTPETSELEAKESLIELARLVTTLGYKVVGTESQRLPSTKGLTVLGEGKLEELVLLRQNTFATKVIFDCDLSPFQVRNVENAVGASVLDRTGVIIEIFSLHAKTRAAQLQVEIARQKYLVPRLKELGAGKEHQNNQRTGESGLEIEKRKIRDRMNDLKQELEAVQQDEKNRRDRRAEQLCVALVGYTNAGKSSLMRGLTGSEVLVEDKLFATLDTTVRALQPETAPRILVTDTVGFINKLPHDLVASFRSTLDEAKSASLLLYVVDASDNNFRSQLTVVKEVLLEIKAENTPHLLILNKSDCLNDAQRENLAREFSESIFLSTRNAADVQSLRESIIAFFEKDMTEEEILVPYTAQKVIGEMRLNMKILKESYEEEGTRFMVLARASDLNRLKKIMSL